MFNLAISQMRKNSINHIFIVLILFVFGCSSPKDLDPSVKGTSRYSQWLSYKKTPNGIFIFIKDPEAKNKTRTLLCTTQPNALVQVASSVEVIDVRSLKLATNAATHVGMLVELNARTHIGAVSLGKYLHDSQLKHEFEAKNIIELGGGEIPFESLVQKQIGLWVSNGMGPIDVATQNRFKALKMSWVPNYDWREAHPLGKAEWILFFGALTNRFDEAMEIYKGICERYNNIAKCPKGNSCEKILLGNFAGDFWYSPLQNSFQAKFLSEVDFCTFSMNQPGTGSMAVGAERIFKEAQSCKIWLNPGFSTKQGILNAFPKANVLWPFNRGKIFCYSYDINKFWEQSATKPDVVLRDLLSIKQGVTNESKLYFYREVK